MKEIFIKGTGRYVPEKVVTNFDLAEIVDTNDEWISSRTGIKERRITVNENTSDLAYHASLKALKNAGIDAMDLDLIIVGTVTPDMVTPATSCILQSKLKAKKAAAFDINAACSGFIYAVDVAKQFIQNGVYNNILVVGSETLSKIVNWEDRNTCVLFGDGAGAAVISSTDKKGIGSVIIGSDGEKGGVLKCDGLQINNPYAEKQDGLIYNNYVVMEGREVFKFATSVIVESIEEILKRENLDINEIDYIVPHQANLRIIDYAARKLEVDINKFYVNLDRYGNTSSASIPMALDEMNDKGLLKNGDKIIIVGFGGGLTYGAAYIQWQK